jgi:hypothetical protein
MFALPSAVLHRNIISPRYQTFYTYGDTIPTATRGRSLGRQFASYRTPFSEYPRQHRPHSRQRQSIECYLRPNECFLPSFHQPFINLPFIEQGILQIVEARGFEKINHYDMLNLSPYRDIHAFELPYGLRNESLIS